MNKIIIEVGSTVIKIDEFDGKVLNRLKNITIFFKKNYNEYGHLKEEDINELINITKEYKEKTNNIYVCGTSIFRFLNQEERELFLNHFKKETNLDFHIITDEDECRLTVLGATRCVSNPVCVFIGGGGSTEIAIYNNKISEMVNSKIGVIDVTKAFPNLADDIATTSLEEVMNYIKDRISLPQTKSDILILAGGSHELFTKIAGIKYENNILYDDIKSPIMMDIETRINESKRYYEEISLDNIRSQVEDPDWWYGTRAMCAFVLVVAEAIRAKYIVPTDIGMAYGLID